MAPASMYLEPSRAGGSVGPLRSESMYAVRFIGKCVASLDSLNVLATFWLARAFGAEGVPWPDTEKRQSRDVARTDSSFTKPRADDNVTMSVGIPGASRAGAFGPVWLKINFSI